MQFKVIQPQVIRPQQTLTGTNLEEGELKTGNRHSRDSPGQPQKGGRVGVTGDTRHSRIPLEDRIASKTQLGPGTELTPFPLPPPHNLIPPQLDSAPANNAFPVNQSHSREDSSTGEPSVEPPPLPGGGGGWFNTDQTSLSHLRRGHHHKQFPCVSSSSRNHDRRVTSRTAASGGVSGPAKVHSPPPDTSSSFHPQPHCHPSNPPPHTSGSNPLSLGFEETVRLVASCTAAATAAAITSQRVSVFLRENLTVYKSYFYYFTIVISFQVLTFS